MGRPALAPGTAGTIRFFPLPDGRVQARCLFRDHDGHSRPLTRIGKTKTAAERSLQVAIRDRKAVTGDALIRSDMRMGDLADLWLERIDASDKAINTKQQYRKLVDAYVRPMLGQLRVAEATIPACDRALRTIAIERGPSVGKACRAVLSGMMGLAARHGAVPSNPVRDTEPIAGASKPKKGRPRALTRDETERVSDGFRSLARAMPPSEENRVGLDLADLVDLDLATGARIGELLACREEALDLDAGTWEVNATIIRVGGVKVRKALEAKEAAGTLTAEEAKLLHAYRTLPPGLHLQRRTKSEAGWRVLALPPHAVQMLRDRREQLRLRGPEGVVFGSPARRAFRDPSNTAGDLKECLRLLGGYDQWVTFHTFRKTVATRMEEAGCTPREVADQLGHSKPSMTQDVYFGRSVVTARAAEILAR